MEKKKRGFLDGKTAMVLTLLGLLVVSGYINYRKAATEPIGGEVSVVRIEGERPTAQPSPTPAAWRRWRRDSSGYSARRMICWP